MKATCDCCAKFGTVLEVCDACLDADMDKARADGAAAEREACARQIETEFMHREGGQWAGGRPCTCEGCRGLRIVVADLRARGEPYANKLEAEVKSLLAQLHDVHATPMSSWAAELAAARENVAGTAALLEEAQKENAEVRDLALKALRAVQEKCPAWRQTSWADDLRTALRALEGR